MFKGRKRKHSSSDGPSDTPPPWASFFDSAQRYERFEQAVRRHFRGRGQSILIQEGRVVGPAFGELQLGLTNLGQVCARSDEHEWPALIARHFDAVLQSQHEGSSAPVEFEAVRDQLATRLYLEADIADILDVTIVRQDVPGLCSTLCLDLPTSVQTVRRDRVSAWGRSDDELFELARDNLKSLIDAEPELVQIDQATSLWLAGGDSVYNSSILLRLEDYPQFRGRHGMFISAPTRHLVLALPFDAPEAMNSVGHLMGLTAHMEREGPGSLSTQVWWQRDGRWIELPWEMTDDGISVRAPEEFAQVLEEIAADE
jgi:hypothetical protein